MYRPTLFLRSFLFGSTLYKSYSRLPLLSTKKFKLLERMSESMPAPDLKTPHDKILVAFDFDKTLIDDNSDTFILRMLPGGEKDVLIYQKMHWTDYMQKVFDLLWEAGVKKPDMRSCLVQLSWTPGMQELVQDLCKAGHDIIIISDCNTFFINTFLASNGMQDCFQQVFTNPAEFDDHGRLKIRMFHCQTWCELSAVNLCKGAVLDDFIRQKAKVDKVNYKFVAYVGDGMNDYCPMLRLSTADLAFPRVGFPCQQQIISETIGAANYRMRAEVIPWQTGFEVRDTIFNRL